MPYSGISVMMRKIVRVMAVQNSFSLNPTLRFGRAISGRNLEIGLNSVRNFPAMWWSSLLVYVCLAESLDS